MTAELHTRRTALTVGAATAGAVAGTVALTACGSSDSGSNTPQDQTGTGTGTGTGAGDAPSGDQPLAALEDIGVGEAKAVTMNGEDVIVSRPDDTTAAAFSAVCTHQGCKVQPDGAELRCPCHGSVFDAGTGEVRNGPASEPLPKVNVRVQDGQILPA
ncbi:ubiquinol-cytochrome c reductase iron-sulfur subunit [Amycolatopsis cihanbeyliensis]|uniref:Cytochrome bc1 complex Rieske iron-sulfur subunit n=1 Tax=Amycolatopsis cihanbeyliensis TaxID=1128664 RepID=A0A542CT04_AMYCI|nr:Rieske (2Fe-2S) protein [Amycolatopsis cihanbeyliensis]TQI93966.1 nitrite reductase/ring-hydroxylating ferredoxin subunit [Amycolatopsis cihanbeyliensis]